MKVLLARTFRNRGRYDSPEDYISGWIEGDLIEFIHVAFQFHPGSNLHGNCLWVMFHVNRVTNEVSDNWYGKDIERYSLSGKVYAETNSWDVLKSKYLSALERVVSK